MLSFIDLFSGIGGFRLGFQSKKAKCVFSCEIDKWARQTYQLNFKQEPFEDIRLIKKIPEHDILLAGFPCQSFSVAGNKKGIFEPRGSLFYEIVKILRAKKPKAFLLENVKGLLFNFNRQSLNIIFKSLREAGYFLHLKILSSEKYANIPQMRERLFIVGFKKQHHFEFPPQIPLTKKLSDFIDNDKKEEHYYLNRFPHFDLLKKGVTKTNTIYQWRRTHLVETKAGLCHTLTANMGKGGYNTPIIKDKYGIRKLTPRECIRLQGFPESFRFPKIKDYHLYTQIGNSVCVSIVKRIAQEIKFHLSKGKKEI